MDRPPLATGLAAVAAAGAVGYVVGRLTASSQAERSTASSCCSGTFDAQADLSHEDGVRSAVRQAYGERAGKSNPEDGCCSGSSAGGTLEDVGKKLGYTEEDLSEALDGNLGEGCGNPISFAGLKTGETVVDLGSGAGIDCLIARKRVGPTGCVIGVDMTPEMISKARDIVRTRGIANVTYRLGEIEHLPVADCSVDAVISNCVINLAPDQKKVYADVFRILRDGGRLAIADVVSTAELPENLKTATALAC